MDSHEFRIGWRPVAGVSFVVTVAAMATLTIVATNQSADALATIALYLAILSFVVQILVFIGQSWTTLQQSAQSQALNAETQKLLTEISTRAGSTENLMGGHFTTLLDAFVIAQKSDDPRAALEAARLRQGDGQTVAVFRREEDRRAFSALTSFPDEERGRELLRAYGSLTPWALITLQSYVDDEIRSRIQGVPAGLYLKEGGAPGTEHLIRRGMLEEIPTPFKGDPSGHRYARLTEHGRDVGRLLAGQGPMPDYLREAIEAELREREEQDAGSSDGGESSRS